ncbi:MAG: hypothetical protein QOH72_3355 [Solirubrobacteraceae bacterium]|nr:hypothetical protein [Solirubrobacteraceae bacterium]
MSPTEPSAQRPLCVLLLPAPLERFILRDQAEDLLRAPGVVAVGPGRVPAGAYGRLPGSAADRLAALEARRVLRALPAGTPRAVVIFHALQEPVARAILAAVPGGELWYWRWDRYERAYDASPRMRARIEALHDAAAARAALVPAVSEELVRLERAAGRDAALVPMSADGFPAPEGGGVVAISLGHLGRRTDWALLRAVAERLGDDLVVLLVGALHEDECAGDPDFAAVRAMPQFVWLGALGDEAAARLILCADVGIVPFRVEPFNDAALPYRIIKYARLGRKTVTPPLAGVRTWARAVDLADGADAFAEALRAHAGARMRPDAELRDWALAQTARSQNEPVWARLRALGIAPDGA